MGEWLVGGGGEKMGELRGREIGDADVSHFGGVCEDRCHHAPGLV